jgi:hypothetical protein
LLAISGNDYVSRPSPHSGEILDDSQAATLPLGILGIHQHSHTSGPNARADTQIAHLSNLNRSGSWIFESEVTSSVAAGSYLPPTYARPGAPRPFARPTMDVGSYTLQLMTVGRGY